MSSSSPDRRRTPSVASDRDPATPLGVALLGSGGSIGTQAAEVLAGLPDLFRVVAVATGSNGALLEEQARRLRPSVVSLADEHALATLDLPPSTERVSGPDALQQLATRDDVDIVLVATGGVVSLRPVLAALATGRVVATANKETVVAAGHLVMPLARARAAEVAATDPTHPLAAALGWLRPIDSEHSAIWQCLVGEGMSGVERIVLTASGGPFRETPLAELGDVTPERALRHPTWSMGAKITIDSATLANKGLEVIEAHWLYDVAYDAIDVVVHPQSVVHSAVLFRDGSLKAQLGTPDMRIPIQYSLTYPARRPSPATPPNLIATGALTFEAPDEERFPALRIARDAGRMGPRATAALIAADEVAVARFLDGTLEFMDIPRLLEAAVDRFGRGGSPAPGVGELEALDREVDGAFAAPWRPDAPRRGAAS
jgi:1-deoxy-D-xylulose-5-phosphate reductoisomerase